MSTTTEKSEKALAAEQDFLPLMGTDFVELYVGNAKQAAHYYMSAWGFQPLAYAGLETGCRDRVSYVLQQGKIRLVLTSPLVAGGPINQHINDHGDGVKVVALWVEDAKYSYEQTTQRGAESALEPVVLKDKDGEVVISAIKTYGETLHYFVEKKLQGGLHAGISTLEPCIQNKGSRVKIH